MGSVYKRGSFWWIAFKVPGGQRVLRSTGISSAEPEREARKVLLETERQLKAEGPRSPTSKTTMAEYAVTWANECAELKKTNALRDLRRLELYVLPTLGAKRLRDVTTLDVRAMVKTLKKSHRAPRTIIDTYGLMRRLFSDAKAEGLIDSNPCELKKGELPKKRDKDPSWRAGAVFSREEAELLLSSPKIPLDRRVTYGLGLLGGMREGEIAAVRVRSYEPKTEPLGRILVVASYTRHNGFEKSTKTGNPREVPVHPTLARLLTEWLERGFVEMFGREPRPDDLLVPNHWGSYRIDSNFWQGLDADLKALGNLRRRRFHDTRRTFASLGRTDGAIPAVLKSVSHDQVGDQFDQYTTFTFEAKCEAVLCLKLTGRTLRSARSKVASGAPATQLLHDEETDMRSSDNSGGFGSDLAMPRTGVEPVSGTSHSTSRRAISRGSDDSGRHKTPLTGVPRSNVATSAIEAELAETLADFRKKGDKSRLAARLRQLLIRVRS